MAWREGWMLFTRVVKETCFREKNIRVKCYRTLTRHNFIVNNGHNLLRSETLRKNYYIPFAGLSFGIGIGSYYYVSKYKAKVGDIREKIRKFSSVQAAEVFDYGLNAAAAATHSSTEKYNFIADVVEKAAPAVVYIEIKTVHPFFGDRPVAVSNGSGFLVRSDGLILTNAHVVANMKTVTVKLYDGRVFEGHVISFDRNTDLATVKINAKNLPVLKLGSSAKVRPGEWVVAMGSPLSLSNTITAGIISSVNRGSRELGLHKEMEYIQTDAAINFGNSGGPLVNLDGEVVGISTMKVTTGISFAIPADYAAEFLKQTESKTKNWLGKVVPNNISKKQYLGITMLTLNPNLVLELQQRNPDFPLVQSGVLVWKVILGSPAHWGGIQPGDIITDINGKPVKSANDIYAALENNTPIKVTVRRKNEVFKLIITPQEAD
ncbi:serine protease HTRA2, mitochondrial isoform X1 [Centruroides vittatus]|uniref:serine protease HTRA2, mitochondrial isoform X1 n=1 Tax=Centruroides vittatus TaxID=120091 RepID=UPI0035106829